jgi:hypothetical protein
MRDTHQPIKHFIDPIIRTSSEESPREAIATSIPTWLSFQECIIGSDVVIFVNVAKFEAFVRENTSVRCDKKPIYMDGKLDYIPVPSNCTDLLVSSVVGHQKLDQDTHGSGHGNSQKV